MTVKKGKEDDLEQKNKELVEEIEKLKGKIERLKSNKKYGLVWEEKEPEKVVLQCQHKLPILKGVKNKDILNDKDKPVNVLIEGDNYHSLSVLYYTHGGEVDLIYIDPPYNTGNKEFIYNDRYIDKEDTYRHSKWLNFMDIRLRLAQKLLKKTGVIFISINEDELGQLKLLCDRIFDIKNYLTIFTIKVRHENRILKGDKDFHEVVEYLLLYRNTSEHRTIKRIQDNTSVSEYVFEIEELIKNPQKIKMGSKEVEIFRLGDYKIIKNKSSKRNLKKINIRGTIKQGNSSGRFYMAHLEKRKKDLGYLYKVPNIGLDGRGHRYFLAPTSEKKVNGDYFQGVPHNIADIKEVPYPNFYDFEREFNRVGYEGGVDFREGKKPINFLMKIFEMGGVKQNKNALIVDFFAGSGSTGEALLRLNQQDGGNRKFILCTNNEVNFKKDTELRKMGIKHGDKKYEVQGIAQKICYPRLKSVIDKEIKSNLRYFKTDFVDVDNIAHVSDEQKIKLTYKAGEMIALRENTFEDVEKNEWWQIFKANEQHTAIYFKEDKSKLRMLVKKLSNINNDVVLYIFSWGKNEYRNEFSEYENIKVKDIPQPIIGVYKEINRL